ncbi:hypothetical protein ES319_D10G029500v1 [Gossypium barbadense]|uniref:ADP/ATP translocase n=3 Tax=Gossypium TaxID=3633 RepID=A0A5J5PPS2_GOSBA|nr:hypothetical protein ES319_D10G029500v1 [Gossypium barbadense]TYG48629.1 hypothetical protein ES288_D10G030700v1 [Gossypium darwinii]TYH47906.1 hypothetical protein ES332_D10G031200v1 [Gossypium tomentosum]
MFSLLSYVCFDYISLQTIRVSCRTEHEPLHPPISQKIHWQLDLSFRHFNYTTPLIESIRGNGASSVVKPMPAAFVGAPMESSKASFITKMVLLDAAKAAVAPFERVKLLMQNQNDIIKSGRLPKPYNGIFHCFATTIRHEGIFSLWRGYPVMAIGDVFSKVIRYNIFEYAKTREDIRWTSMRVLELNCVAFFATQLLVHPFLYAGTRMATDVKITGNSGQRQFNGITDFYRKTLKSFGIVGLYRGFNITLVELVMLGALSTGLSPWKQYYSYILQNDYLSRVMVEFGFDICGKMATYSMDTVSRRMMMTWGGVKYKSTLHAIAQIWKTEGVKTFYNGAGAEILLCAAYTGTVMLVIYVADVIRAATEKGSDDGRSALGFTARWKDPRGK